MNLKALQNGSLKSHPGGHSPLCSMVLIDPTCPKQHGCPRLGVNDGQMMNRN